MSDAQDELLVDQVLEFRGGPIVVVGDLLLDRWITGTADRISREAPAPVVQVRGREDAPGGAANTAVNLAALGADVRLVGLVGDDEAGSSLLALLAAAGVDVTGVVRGSGGTTVKTRICVAGQVLMRFDEGEPAEAADGDAVAAALRVAMVGSAAVLVCDYGMDAAGPAVRAALAEERGSGPLVLDAHDLAPWTGVRVDVVTPNAGETERLLGRALGADRVRAASEAGEELRQRTGSAAVIVTLDRDGTVVHGRAGAPSRTLAKPAPDANTNGAGDTFAAALVLALAAGLDVHRAARFGQLAADVVTRLPGTSVCTAEQLTASLAGGARLLDERSLVAALAVARAAGKRIVFTNGCFDVLHRGHTAYLKQAKALGDLLVVAVNDDESTRRLKGPGRPVNPVADRAGVVAELACVDFVTVFSTDTPIPLLETIAPDVYAKGGDYLPDMLAETPVVEANGGVVRILDYISPHSTSDLIARVRAAGVAGA